MATLIDSSVLIAAERCHLDFDDISALTASELLHGLHLPRTVAQRHRRQAFAAGLLAQLPAIAFDLTVARVLASLWAVSQYRSQCTNRGVGDGRARTEHQKRQRGTGYGKP